MPNTEQSLHTNKLLGLHEAEEIFLGVSGLRFKSNRIFYGIERIGGHTILNPYSNSIKIILPYNKHKSREQNIQDKFLRTALSNGISVNQDDNVKTLTINSNLIQNNKKVLKELLCSLAVSPEENIRISTAYEEGVQKDRQNIKKAGNTLLILSSIACLALIITLFTSAVAIPILILSMITIGTTAIGVTTLRASENSLIGSTVNKLFNKTNSPKTHTKKHEANVEQETEQKYREYEEPKTTRKENGRTDELLNGADWFEDDINKNDMQITHGNTTQHTKSKIK